jgi:hypothetical protein
MFELSRPCFTAPSFLVNKQILNRLGRVVRATAAVAVLGMCASMAWAAQQATTTALAVTAGGAPVTTVPAQTVVTLTATVTAGGAAVTTGQVKFCDATATYCTDIHVLGTAQVTSAGFVTFKFKPGGGSRSYKAVFVGTNAYATSTSSISSLVVTGSPIASTTTIAQSGITGNYTLTATVTGQGNFLPTGTVSFLDTGNSNSVLGTGLLGGWNTTVSWLNPQSPATGANPESIVVGDFNGDGIPDLAAANYGNSGNNSLTVSLGKGDGTFTTSTTFPGLFYDPESIAAGDFNGDGKLDLVVASVNSTITILLGNGDGTFTASTLGTSSPFGGAFVAAGDFNGDGILDLAIANQGQSFCTYCTSSVTILLGKGDGTFTPAAASPATGSYPSSIAVGDLNGDGKADLAITCQGSNTVTILLGNGDGTFTSAPAIQNAPVQPRSVAIADFNGDGMPDLAVGGDVYSGLVMLGKGDGTFAPATSVPMDYASSIAVGDFNGDGKVDLATVWPDNNTVATLLGKGDGTFVQGASPLTGNFPWAITSADLNGDGVADLALANTGGSTVTVLTSQLTRTATASAAGIVVTGPGVHQVDASYPGDANFGSSVSATAGLTAGPLAIALSLRGNPSSGSTYTQQVVFTATLSPYNTQANSTNGETVTFLNGASVVGTGTLSSGVATLNLTSLPSGTDNLTASYAGDAAFSPATSSILAYPVSKATPVITWPNPPAILYGTALSAAQLNATSPIPGVFAYTPSVGTVLNAGSHPLSASFAPTDTADCLPASGANTLMVNQAPLTVTAANASRAYGAANPVFTSSAAGVVNGDLILLSGSSVATRTSAVGAYPIVPLVSGTNLASYSVSNVNGTLAVTPATGLTVVPGTATRVFGAANSVMMGSVTGVLNGDTFTVTGATTATASSPVGTYPITYTVTGANIADYFVTQTTGTLTVTAATPVITWAAPGAIGYGTSLSAAQLNATASTAGTFSYSPALGAVLGAGTQTLSVTFTPTDTTDYAMPSASTVQLAVNKAPLAITANSTARVFGAANPAFSGTVSGAVNGDAFTESFATSATAASIAGSYPIVPAVAGANLADYAVMATNGALSVTQAGTATTFALSNSDLTMTATVLSLTSGTPTGNVAFYQGQTLVGTGTLANGTATFTTANFPAGNVVVSAQYSGDANFTQSASPPIFVLTVNPAQTQLTVAPAGSVSDALTLTAASGFTGTLQFSCGGLPADAICSFSPTSYTFTGSSNSASVTMTVLTGVSACAGQGPLARPGLTTLAGVFFVPLLVLFGGRRRTRVQLLMFLLVLGGVCGLVTACGSSPQSPAGTSTVQVVASGASGFQQMTSVTLTVQ